MKRSHLTLLTICGLGAFCPSTAQEDMTLDHLWRRYPGVTSHNTRYGIAPSQDGFVGLSIADTYVLGLFLLHLNQAWMQAFQSVQFDMQDNNAQTQEPSRLQIRRLRNGVPGVNQADILFETGSFSLPQGFGTKAYRVDVDLGQPVVNLPLGEMFLGLYLPRNVTYPADGLSLHAASYDQYAQGDNPRTGAPVHAFGVPTGSNPVQPERSTPAVGLWGADPILNVLADVPTQHRRGPNPSWGMAGLYPDVSRGDGLQFWFRHDPSAFGRMFLFLSIGHQTLPILLPGVSGGLWLDSSLILPVANATIPANGMVTLAPNGLRAGQLPTVLRGFLSWQAVAISPTNQIAFTNCEITKF